MTTIEDQNTAYLHKVIAGAGNRTIQLDELPEPSPGWRELTALTREQLLAMAADALAAAEWLEAQS